MCWKATLDKICIASEGVPFGKNFELNLTGVAWEYSNAAWSLVIKYAFGHVIGTHVYAFVAR